MNLKIRGGVGITILNNKPNGGGVKSEWLGLDAGWIGEFPTCNSDYLVQ